MRIWPVGLAFGIATGSADAATSVAIFPPSPFVDRASGASIANFDLIVRNDEARPAEISEVTIDYLDASGLVLFERRLDENGSAPSIDTLGDHILKPGATRLVFNPFPAPPADIRPSAIKARVTLTIDPDAAQPGSRDVSAVATLREPPAAAQQLTLPLAGRVLVWDGHDALSHHRRWDFELPGLESLGFRTNGMRYAYDFVRVDAAGERVHGDPKINANHLSWKLPVRSPAAGTVVDIETTRPDDGSADFKTFVTRPNLVFGNYVVIKHAEGVFSLLGHLHQGSVRVRVGERVAAGEVVAQVGCSGTSLFPHLHYQAMTGPTMAAEGVPTSFRDVTLMRGLRLTADTTGVIDSGDVVTAQ